MSKDIVSPTVSKWVLLPPTTYLPTYLLVHIRIQSYSYFNLQLLSCGSYVMAKRLMLLFKLIM